MVNRMSQLRKEYLITYDIVQNKKRNNFFNILKNFGLISIQKSVFWGEMSHSEKLAVIREAENLFKQEDKLVITEVNFTQQKMIAIGYSENQFQINDYEFI